MVENMKQQVYDVIRQDGTKEKVCRIAETKFLGIVSLVCYLKFLNDIVGIKNKYTHFIYNRRKYTIGVL